MPRILIDADACPVKQEVYRVAARYEIPVTLVANAPMRVPEDDRIELVVVGEAFDAADDWIVEHVGEDDIVISGDILLASRCIKKRALVLGPTGRLFTEEGIGEAVATRDLLSHLRAGGAISGGPAPLERKDRSRFLQRLDELILAVRRRARP
jgi:hypothetical protein